VSPKGGVFDLYNRDSKIEKLVKQHSFNPAAIAAFATAIFSKAGAQLRHLPLQPVEHGPA
jgi:hypothetical protein